MASFMQKRVQSRALVDDDELLLAIQQALKPRRSSAPKLEHLAVAVALARDPQLLVSTTCKMVQIDAHHAKHAEIIARETEAFWKQVEAEQEQLAWFRRAKMQGGCKDCDQ